MVSMIASWPLRSCCQSIHPAIPHMILIPSFLGCLDTPRYLALIWGQNIPLEEFLAGSLNVTKTIEKRNVYNNKFEGKICRFEQSKCLGGKEVQTRDGYTQQLHCEVSHSK